MIKEIIVVEGRDDTVAVKRALEADTIETGGSAINEMTLRKIALAQERRGVIIFTDPDHAGERIRKIVANRVPGCKHAFLREADATKRGDIGVENASPEVIREALANVRSEVVGEASEAGRPTGRIYWRQGLLFIRRQLLGGESWVKYLVLDIVMGNNFISG